MMMMMMSVIATLNFKSLYSDTVEGRETILNGYWHLGTIFPAHTVGRVPWTVSTVSHFNTLALELDILVLAHHLCKRWIFDEPKEVTLSNT